MAVMSHYRNHEFRPSADVGTFYLISGTRDSAPIRTSFFVILKNKIYFALFFFLQLLFSSPLYQNLFFLQPQAVIHLCEEYGPNLIGV